MQGLNERFSGGLFGQGTYLAEARHVQKCWHSVGDLSPFELTMLDSSREIIAPEIQDVGKNDQYVMPDTAFSAALELHKHLFADVRHPNEKIFYIILCRVLLGYFVRTQDGSTDMDDAASRSVWSKDQRELAPVIGSNPCVPYLFERRLSRFLSIRFL